MLLTCVGSAHTATVSKLAEASRKGSNSSTSKKKKISRSSLTSIDLFAGAGGFSLAAQNLGIHVAAAVDSDSWAQKTYKKNLIDPLPKKKRPLLYGDIWDIEPQDLLFDAGLEPGQLDLLLGGPPCQGFSSHRINDAGVDDPRNELLLRYFHFVKGLKPKVFLVENVSGLLWKRHAEYVAKFKNLAKRNGYRIVSGSPQVVNARDFGVPQNRKRVFILGIHSSVDLPTDFSWPPEPTHFSPQSNEVKLEGKNDWVPASEVFKLAPCPSDPNDVHMQPGKEMLKRFKKTPLNGGSRSDSGFVLPCHEKHQGHKDVYGRIDPAKPGPTMTTGCINPSKGRFVHPTSHHGITARHAARFQTFPENYVFEGGLGQSGRQIGNAVPVILAQAIILKIRKEILERQ